MPPAAKPAFPNPAAVLPGEADILATVLANLSDDSAKLVYADWLEERADPRGPLLRAFVTAYRSGKKLPAVKAAPKPWCELLGFPVVARARGTVLEDLLDEVLKIAHPAITYKTVKVAEKALPVGSSKFGGRPDLPPGTKWPRFDDRPLSFLGQFNLADLRSSPVAQELPAVGVLSAFCAYDEDDGNDHYPKGSWRLFHLPDPAKLVRHELDDELDAGARFPSCRVEYSEALTLPDTETAEEAGVPLEDSHPADDVYREIYYTLCPQNHILGHAFPIQGRFWRKDTRHLLSIAGNDQTGWGFGDGGVLYFTLSTDALTKGRFDLVKMEMQCG